MRIILMLAFLLPLTLNAQIKHSYNTLAKENINSYLKEKIFPNDEYQISDYGNVERFVSKTEDLDWKVKYSITWGRKTEGDEKFEAQDNCDFYFYLDKLLRVQRIERVKMD